MTIQELIDQFEIQGAFHIKSWVDDVCDYETMANGNDFDCDRWKINEEVFERKITYMYAVDGVLIIEVE